VKRLEHYWQSRNLLAWVLLPLSWLYCGVAALRRAGYRSGMLVSRSLPVPVMVVGNISVGGTGKTPLVLWLAGRLRELGYRPGILTRGYGGSPERRSREVRGDSDPADVGDEAVLLARHAGCPVLAGPERVESGRLLVENYGCDLIISDDGLQHYALNRDLEIAVIDGRRRFGNGFCLPAGPLRERPARLRSVDLVVTNGSAEHDGLWMELTAQRAVNLADPSAVKSLETFRGKRVTAVAGVGNPDRFFAMLRGLGLEIQERPFPDHYRFRLQDLEGLDGTVLMTEKDAVKCEKFAGPNCWYVPAETRLHPTFDLRLKRFLDYSEQDRGLRKDG